MVLLQELLKPDPNSLRVSTWRVTKSSAHSVAQRWKVASNSLHLISTFTLWSFFGICHINDKRQLDVCDLSVTLGNCAKRRVTFLNQNRSELISFQHLLHCENWSSKQQAEVPTYQKLSFLSWTADPARRRRRVVLQIDGCLFLFSSLLMLSLKRQYHYRLNVKS